MTQLPFTFERFLWLPGDVAILELTGDLDVPRWAVPYSGARLHVDGEAHPCVLVPCAQGPVGPRKDLWALRFAAPPGFDHTLAKRFELSLPTFDAVALPAPTTGPVRRRRVPRVPRVVRTAAMAATLAPFGVGPLVSFAGAESAGTQIECIVETALTPEGEPCPPEEPPVEEAPKPEPPPTPDPPKPDPPQPDPPTPQEPKPEPPKPDEPKPEPPKPDEPNGQHSNPDHGKPAGPPATVAVAPAAPVPEPAAAPAEISKHLAVGRRWAGARETTQATTRRGPRAVPAPVLDKPSSLRRGVVRRAAAKLTKRTAGAPAPAAATITADAPTGFVLPSAAYGGEPDIPAFLLPIYHKAARRYDIPWSVLAAVNELETDFGRNVAVSSAGARGWMQFMPGTWRAYGVDADGDGKRDWDDPEDAIFAAARYLRASGGRSALRRALFAYNHAHWYVEAVLLRAARISQMDGRSPSIQRLLDDSDRRLRRRVVDDERIKIYDCGREDILHERIDRRVLLLLLYLAESDLHPTVTSLQCGHGIYTASGNVSHHSSGDAVDIAAINGVPVLGNQGAGSVTDIAVRQILRLKGALAPTQIITLMEYPDAPNTFAMGDHHDHIHVGFRPERHHPDR